jgi:ATP-dependent helicase HrpB
VRPALPIDPYLPAIVDLVRRHRALVLSASPGAGKTTRVPPAVAADGPVIVLQPRRVAARSMAQRIAHEQRWTLGNEVGWQVRFERRFSERTRVLIATEGILPARLQQDPLLSDFRTVILDEFHERSIHADLGLALIRQAWKARDDLRVLVMSATLETDPVARYLDGCPVLEVPGQIRSRSTTAPIKRFRRQCRRCCSAHPATCCASSRVRRRSGARSRTFAASRPARRFFPFTAH